MVEDSLKQKNGSGGERNPGCSEAEKTVLSSAHGGTMMSLCDEVNESINPHRAGLIQ